MKFKHIFITLLLLLGSMSSVQAQTTSTFYFMDEVPTRHAMNPAFVPNCSWYLDLIVLPSFYIDAGNNAFALRDGIFKAGDMVVTPFHPTQNIDDLYKRVRPITQFHTRFGLNLLNFGFSFKEKNYLTFDLGLKTSVNIYMPRDLFKLALYGTPDEFGVNSFDFKKMAIETGVYSELGIGYMRKIGKKWTVGGKVKYLMGYANVLTKNRKMELNASQEAWDVAADADIYASVPVGFQTNDVGNIDLGGGITTFSTNDYIKMLYDPAGKGGAIDLGVTYEPVKNLIISAAVTDVGLIHWDKNILTGSMHGNYRFSGIEYNMNDTVDWGKLIEDIGDEFQDAFDLKTARGAAYNQILTASANVGVEYGILKNHISFGVLSQTKIHPDRIAQDFTFALNFRYTDWLKNYITYSLADGRGRNLGLGISFRMGAINTYLVADYIPLNWANLYMSNSSSAIPMPYSTQRINLQAGVMLNFGRHSKDRDRDGVKNRRDRCPNTDIDYLRTLCPEVKRKDFVDKTGCTLDDDRDSIPDCYDRCPNTPRGVRVDEFGCPIDTDGDIVPDYLDKCPDTPTGVLVDEKGCPVDTDGDGVSDYLDKCPNTPAAAIGFTDADGCPKDTDADDVPDYLDKCPDTSTGVLVDEKGCPVDTDSDGVADYLDKCPNTPTAAIGFVDADGCPKDTDADGVPDYLDKCPDTPTDAFVDNSGCPVDTDSDGVPDYLDKCPNTPAAAIGFTDADGCPKDTDGDGVYDFIDKCPNTPTEASVDNSGCPVDTDGDGIPDYLDKCPNTPRDAVGSVDANGCPKDADGDAVPDYLDKCPEVPGVKDNNGCPELKAAVKRLFKQALQGIQFETGKEVIRPSSYAILNQVVEVMKENSDFLLNIAGHTDNVGQPAKNQELSERRAASVKNYLISKGVEEARLTSEGFGDARPVATNQTAAGRKTNRRVEFTVIFER